MTEEARKSFAQCLKEALKFISERDVRMQEFAELLKPDAIEKLERCITTPQGRAFLRGGLHTKEGREWLLGSEDSNGAGELEIRECDLLRWAFTAELMQLRMSSELTLSFVDQGITLRDIKSKTAQDLAEQQWAQVKGLMGPEGYPEDVLAMILYKPESVDVREKSNRGDQPLFEPAEIKKLLEASFSALRDRLAREERKLERTKLKESLREKPKKPDESDRRLTSLENLVDHLESIGEMERDLLVRPGLGLGFDEIRRRSLQNLSEALYYAELNIEGISFADLFQEAVRRANQEAARQANGTLGGHSSSRFPQAVDSAWKEVAEENKHLPFVTVVEGIRQDSAQRSEQAEVSLDLTRQSERLAKNLLQSSIKRAIWQMFRFWKRAIERYPKRGDTLFPVRFYDLLAVSDFHAAAGNHPSPEGIARLTATEDFYFDDAFFRFLYHCEMERRQRGGYRYELVFNGDMLDFAQVVVPQGQRETLTPWPLPPFLEFSPQDPTGRESISARGRSLPFRLFQTLARVHGIGPLAKAAYGQSKVLRAAGKSVAARNLNGFLKDILRAALEEEAGRAALEVPSAELEVASSAALLEELHGPDLEDVRRWLDLETSSSALEREAEEPKEWTDEYWDTWAYDEEWDDWTDEEGWGSDEWAERGTWDSGEWSDEDWDSWAYKEPWPEPDEWAHEAWDQRAGEEWTARDLTRPRVHAMDRDSALEQLADIYRGHRRMFQGLAWFLAQGNRLIVLRGNHDPQWYWPEVQLAFVGWLKNAYVELRKECKSPDNYELPVSAPELKDFLPATKLEEFEARIDFDHAWYYYRDRLAYIEHGGQQEAVDAHRFFLLPVYYEDAPTTAHRKLAIQPEKPLSWLPALQVSPAENEIEPPLGSLGQVFLINNLETQFPNFDRPGYAEIYRGNLKPSLILYLLVALGRTLGALWKWALYGFGPWRRWVWRQVKETPKPRSFRRIAQVIRNLPEWRGGPHDRKLKAYARLTGLPPECSKALDRMSGWVRRWRAPVVGFLFKLFSIFLVLAVVAGPLAVIVLAILEWRTDFLATNLLRDLPWPFSAIVGLFPTAPKVSDPEVVKAWVFNILWTGILGFVLGWIGKQLPKLANLGEDYLYKPSQKVAGILEKYGQAVPYILFGHEHVRNAQRLREGPWYLNTGGWLHKYEKDPKRLLREPLEYAFVRMVDTHRVLAAGPDDYMMPRPETRPEVELLRWNDDGGRVESCETFRGLDELSVSNEYELIRRYEPILKFSTDGEGKPEDFFPMAVENYVRECGLRRRRQKRWVYKPGQTPLHRLGQLREAPRGALRRLYYRLFREPDLHEYYLVFAGKDLTDAGAFLLDQGLVLSRLPSDASFDFVPRKVNGEEQTLAVGPQDQILWTIVSQAQADRLEEHFEFAVQQILESRQIDDLIDTLFSHEHKSAVRTLCAEIKAGKQKVVIFDWDTIAADRRNKARTTYVPYSDWKKHPPVYHYHVCQDEPYTVLQYWFLYAYNDWGFHGGLNDHEGDWEVIFVFLDQKQQPQYVAYSRHIKVPMLFEPETAKWLDVTEPEGSHPIVYVGCGSHASYTKADQDPIAGWIDYHQGNHLQIGPGTAQPWGRPIRLSNKPWNTHFEGNWGALVKHWGQLVLPGTKGPTGPAQKGDKWKKPAKWANIPGRRPF